MIFVLIALVGILLTTVQVFLTRRFSNAPSPRIRGEGRGEGLPFISILKPVCGLDDELEQNLVSFTRLTGVRYEVILSAESWDDPALNVVRRVVAEHPFVPFRVVIDPGTRHGVVNRKVERLIAAARVAGGEILVISDSNVRVEPDDLARTLASFADPRVGCVSNVFTAAGARDLGAAIESLHLLSFVAPGAVLANAAGVPCVVGKSMALTRRALHAIGGFERFRSVLAEDQAIGLAVKDAGFDVVLSPVVVRNVVVARTLQRALDRQVRWNKIRYAFSHATYAAELLLNPLPFALLAAFATPQLALFPLFVIVVRCVQLALLNRALDARLQWHQLALAPVLDALMLYAWFVPFFSNSVTWRGYRARIGRDTVMMAA